MRKYFIFFLFIAFTFACANKENKTAESPKTEQAAIDGAKIFKQSCSICHGLDGKLGANGSKDLTVSDLDLNERIAMVSQGKGLMTAFENILSLAEIKAVAEYSLTLKAN